MEFEPEGASPTWVKFNAYAPSHNFNGTLYEGEALERAQKAVDAGQPAIVNVVTDFRARATTVRFSTMNT